MVGEYSTVEIEASPTLSRASRSVAPRLITPERVAAVAEWPPWSGKTYTGQRKTLPWCSFQSAAAGSKLLKVLRVLLSAIVLVSRMPGLAESRGLLTWILRGVTSQARRGCA